MGGNIMKLSNNYYTEGLPLTIALSGASYSGKTTIANVLKNKLEDEGYTVQLLKEHARNVLKDLKTDLATVRQSRELFLLFENEILVRHIEDLKSADADIVICDRSVYDILAYVIQYSHLIDDEDFKSFFACCEQVFSAYDCIYILEPLPIDEHYFDGTRIASDKRFIYQIILSSLVHYAYLYEYIDSVIKIPVMSIDERIKTIFEDITSYI